MRSKSFIIIITIIVTYFGEFDFSATRTRVDVNNGSLVRAQFVANALDLEVAEVNRGVQKVRIKFVFLFEHDITDGNACSVTERS